MSLFKMFYQCCCQYVKENEEVKGPGNKIESFQNKNSLEVEKFIHGLDESSIIAAPSPQLDGSFSGSPKLQIRIIESSVIEVGTLLSISPAGLENSKRNANDFKVFIGSKLKENDEIINDFVIDERGKGLGSRHLVIKYIQIKQKYCISDLGDGSGTFVKIISPLVLRDGYIVSFGNSHMTIHLSQTSNTLTVKFLEGPKSNEVYNFDPDSEVILVGRMMDCKIRFDDSSMSRYQCSVKYEEGKGWMLFDGIGDKKSTNGTWLFVEEDYEMYDGMVFKAGKTLFEVSFHIKYNI